MNTPKVNRRTFTIGLFVTCSAVSIEGLHLGGRWLRGVRRDLARKAIIDKVDGHCSLAHEDAQQATQKCLAELQAWFDERSTHVYELADDLLCMTAKWNLMASSLPWGDHSVFSRYVEWRFRERLFSAEDLKSRVALVSRHLSQALSGVENRLMVNVRADLAELPSENLAPESPETFAQAYHHAVDAALRDGQMAVLIEGGQLVLDEIITQLMMRVIAGALADGLVSAGILGAGAMGAPETLGISVVLGLIVDQIVGWFTNPEGRLAGKLSQQIKVIENLVFNGTPRRPGIVSALNTFAAHWSFVRTNAIHDYVAQWASTSPSTSTR